MTLSARPLARPFALLVAALALAACGSDSNRASNNNNNGGNAGGGGGEVVEASATDMSLISPVGREDDPDTDVTVTFTLFLPERQEGETVPLIVHSHGFGGSRIGVDEANADPAEDQPTESTDSIFSRLDDQVRLLWDAGYAVVSFDERGFGRGDDGDDGNTGAIQIMDPDFEIQDAIAVLDWIDDPANGVADIIARDDNDNMIAGAIGGSYGGGYQLLLAALDDRLDAITPTATWYNLLQSLLPNEVIKKSYSTGLCLLIASDGAEAGARNSSACDQASDSGSPTARYRGDIATDFETLEEAFLTHGMVEIERRHNEEAGFSMRPVDTLLVQGNRDILFNFNQSYENYRFLNSLGGSDVRLMTNENGHSIAQTRMNGGSQGALGPSSCGPLDSLDSVRAWFDLKLRDNAAAEALLPNEVCISLDDTTAVNLTEVPVASSSNTAFDSFELTIPATSLTAQQNNITSVGGGTFIALDDPIVGDGFVLAGVPMARLTVTNADALAEQNGGATAFIGVAINRGGTIILVDDQVQPLRATPEEMDNTIELPLVGIGENLLDGDQVGVILYGNFDIYEFGTGSVPQNFGANNRFSIEGTVRLPIIESDVATRM